MTVTINFATLDAAIADMQLARDIHAKLVDKLDEEPVWAVEPIERVDAIGDIEWHELWVERYDRVLGLLHGLKGGVPPGSAPPAQSAPGSENLRTGSGSFF